ncbi:MAG: type II toxin-antitoxin system VapC family toxin [Candidatus Omnitrophica bacterium]|nr:type II toxin-antitoxin system VapC family toxin [Candidatus Omnitrophota bacterium]
MSAFVIDASVAVKWFLPEPHAQAARRVLSGRRTLLAPDLIWAEVGNVLWKRCQRAEIAPEAAQRILQEFKRFPLETYPAKALLELAWSLALQHRISVYDGLYLALAVGRHGKLVTADRSLVDAMAKDPLASVVVWVEHLR